MKKVCSIVLVSILLLGVCMFPALASTSESTTLVSHSEELLPDGGRYVVEVFQVNEQARRSTQTGYATATYYDGTNVKIWTVRLQGEFTYTYGVSSKAVSAESSVTIFDSDAHFVSKDAYVSGNTAYGTGTVKYGTVTTIKTVSVSCDIYGNIY